MKNDLTCAVTRDLLPSYVEGLTAPETNQAVEAHLSTCSECAALREALASPTEEDPQAAREVDYLKKVKRRGWKRAALAVLCTAAVLAAALALKVFVIGTPLQVQTLMVSSIREEAEQLHLELSSMASANAYHGWSVETQDGVVSIYAREVLVSPLFSDGTAALTIPLDGVTEIWLGGTSGRLIWQEGTAISPAVQAIYEAQTPYLGDNSTVSALLQELSRWYGGGILTGYTMSLQTASQPYGLTLGFAGPEVPLDLMRKPDPDSFAADLHLEMERLSPLLLALIGNLEEVRWTYLRPDGITQSHTVTLAEVDAALPAVTKAYNADRGTDWEPLESVKDYAASPADLQQLCALVEYGFGYVSYLL